MNVPNASAFVLSVLILLLAPLPGSAQPGAESRAPVEPPPNGQWQIAAGPLTLDVSVSGTANLFHVVDQISEWSQYCHRQYVSWFQRSGGLSGEDRSLLAEHAKIRKAHGWGGGLEQTLYTSLDLEAALEAGVERGALTRVEAEVELRVLSHFKARVDRLMSGQYAVLRGFAERISREADLEVFSGMMARFVGVEKLTVPMQMIANPDDASIGGGFNGGILTLEIPGERDAYPTLLHELFHAFIMTKWNLIESAVRSTPGLDLETLSEGLAYACNPGLVHAGADDVDVLKERVAGYMSRGQMLKDSYARFNLYGLALRPLLKDSLDREQTLEELLPRAADAWRVLVEIESARTGGGGKQ